MVKFYHKVQNLHSCIFNQKMVDDSISFSRNHSENNHYTFNFNLICSFLGSNQNCLFSTECEQIKEPVTNLSLKNYQTDKIGSNY